jgi:hypothetical protein
MGRSKLHHDYIKTRNKTKKPTYPNLCADLSQLGLKNSPLDLTRPKTQHIQPNSAKKIAHLGQDLAVATTFFIVYSKNIKKTLKSSRKTV